MEMPTLGKAFTTLKRRAVVYVFACAILILFVNVILELMLGLPSDVSSHLGILAGGLLGWKCYSYENPGWKLSAQRRDFHWIVPLTVLLLEWSLCNLISHLYGTIASVIITLMNGDGGASPDNMPVADTLIMLIGAVVIAPFGEELIFRQCGTGLLKDAGSKWFALLFPTALFSALHMNYGMQGILQVFTGGMIYALCYYYTENIFYSMLAHGAHNLMVSFRFTQIRGMYKYDLLQPVSLVTNLVMLAVGLFLLIRFVYPREIKPARAAEHTRIAENTGKIPE